MSKLPHNRTWYTKKLAEKAKLCVKDRDKRVCQMCGKECYGSDCHASHVYNVGSHKNMELDPENMKVLCSYHHLHWWHKDVMESGRWFEGKFPERFDYLRAISKSNFKIATADLAELHEDTKADGSDYAKKYYALLQKVIGGME